MNDKAMEVFFEALITGDTSRAIENQEKRGQMEQAHSETLPRQCPRQDLEALGFVFEDSIQKDADDIFINVKFPDGWRKQATDHAMWTDLLDDKGRKRGGIFYKAAFYDRSAHMYLTCRYSSGTAPVNGWNSPTYHTDPVHGIVTDCDTIIWHSDLLEKGEDEHAFYQAQDDLKKQARAWLGEHYPAYDSPLAYWD